MPFDALQSDAPVTPDLTEPSPEALAYVLRRKELWPTYFRQQGWDYTHTHSCAIGLCRSKWGTEGYLDICGTLGLHRSLRVFHDAELVIREMTGSFLCMVDVTPEHVATVIDHVLATESSED